MDEIIFLASSIAELYKYKYEMLKPVVIDLINRRVSDKNIIIKYLDELLDIPTNEGKDLFNFLCEYCKSIDNNLAGEYINIWKELWEEEYDEQKNK